MCWAIAQNELFHVYRLTLPTRTPVTGSAEANSLHNIYFPRLRPRFHKSRRTIAGRWKHPKGRPRALPARKFDASLKLAISEIAFARDCMRPDVYVRPWFRTPPARLRRQNKVSIGKRDILRWTFMAGIALLFIITPTETLITAITVCSTPHGWCPAHYH